MWNKTLRRFILFLTILLLFSELRNNSHVNCVTFSPDGQQGILVGHHITFIARWSLSSARDNNIVWLCGWMVYYRGLKRDVVYRI
jgi:hypothetical protein